MTEKQAFYERKLASDTPLENLNEVEELLYNVLPSSPKALFRRGEGIDRSRNFFELIDNPQDAYKSIHIAGTSGKGSVSYYLSNLLAHHGFKVGTHVSPHVYDIRERAMINMKLISERMFVGIVNDLLSPIRRMDKSEFGRPTYFEVTNAIAFSLFADEEVDYAVIETGLGGLYDSTNTINRRDKLSVITKLGFDHTEILGNTLEDIAAQKAGIFNTGGESIFIEPEHYGAKETIKSIARDVGNSARPFSPNIISRPHKNGLTFDYKSVNYSIDNIVIQSLGRHQPENAALAICALEHLSERDGFALDSNSIRSAIFETILPGRLELRNVQGQLFILDGSHNPQKIGSLVASIEQAGMTEKPLVIFGSKKTKDIKEMISNIAQICGGLIPTTFFSEQNSAQLHGMALPTSKIASTARDLGIPVVGEAQRPQQAVEMALNYVAQDQPILVAGSFYLLGEINPAINSLSRS